MNIFVCTTIQYTVFSKLENAEKTKFGWPSAWFFCRNRHSNLLRILILICLVMYVYFRKLLKFSCLRHCPFSFFVQNYIPILSKRKNAYCSYHLIVKHTLPVIVLLHAQCCIHTLTAWKEKFFFGWFNSQHSSSVCRDSSFHIWDLNTVGASHVNIGRFSVSLNNLILGTCRLNYSSKAIIWDADKPKLSTILQIIRGWDSNMEHVNTLCHVYNLSIITFP